MKTALAISGGGATGAFSVGAIEVLMREYGIEFDIAAGTSTGAIIAPTVALNDIESAVRLYTSVENKDILALNWKKWFIDGIYTTEPLRNTINKYTATDTDMYKKLMTSRTEVLLCQISLQSRQKVYYSQSGRIPGTRAWSNYAEFVEAILGSANQPIFMRPATIGGEQFVDGGIREVLPLEICMQQGVERIIAVRSQAEEDTGRFVDQGRFNLLEIGSEALSIMIQEIGNTDIRYVKTLVEIQNQLGVDLSPWAPNLPKELIIIQPPHGLSGSLTFKPERMAEQMALGRSVARTVMQSYTKPTE